MNQPNRLRPRGDIHRPSRMPGHPQHRQVKSAKSLAPHAVQARISPKIRSENCEKLRSIKEVIENSEKTYNQSLYGQIGAIVEIARNLEKSPDEWVAFSTFPVWEKLKRGRPNPNKCENALRRCLDFVLGFESLHQKKRASKIHCAIAGPYNGGASSAEIAEILKAEGGIEKLAYKASKRGEVALAAGAPIYDEATEAAVAHLCNPGDGRVECRMALDVLEALLGDPNLKADHMLVRVNAAVMSAGDTVVVRVFSLSGRSKAQ
jgi:hypothetical protein